MADDKPVKSTINPTGPDWEDASSPSGTDWVDVPSNQIHDSLLDKIGHGLEDVAYPAVGAGVGALLGAESGPVGIGTGAALGAGAGTEIKRGVRAARGRSDLNPSGWGHVAETGADMLTGPIQEAKAINELPAGIKLALPSIIDDISKVSPRTARLMNDYLGLNLNDLPKYERMRPGTAAEIGSTAYQQAGLKNNLSAQKAAIDDAIQRNITNNDKLIGAVPTEKKSDIANLIVHSGSNLLDELAQTPGISDTNVNAAGRLIDEHLDKFGKEMTPQEMLSFRRMLGNQIKNWNPSTANPVERFRQMLYHDLNDEIASHLDGDAQDAFQKNNRTINRLIIASQAAGEKLNRGDLKTGFSPGKAIVGALGGAVMSPHAPGVGALVGAGAMSAVDHIPQGMLANLDLHSQKLAEGIYEAAKQTGQKIAPETAVQLARHIISSNTNILPQR